MRASTFGRGIHRVKQHDVTDCGAACLFSVASHFGLRLPLSRIRQYAGTDRRGTTVLGMVEAATRLGFVAKGVKGPFESLRSIPLPAIAHVVIGQVLHHFVVVYQLTSREVVVMDPADGEVHRVPHERFRTQWTGVLVLLVPGDAFHAMDQTTSAPRRFWALLHPHRAVMAQALLGAALYTLLGLSSAVYVQKIVDHVLVDGDRGLLNLLSLGMLAVLAVQVYVGCAKDLLTLRTGQQLDAALILGYYHHLLRLPQRFFDTMRVGEILSRVSDAVKIRAFINDVSVDLVVDALVLVFSFALMFVYSWQLALVMLCLVPLYALIYLLNNRVNRRVQRRLMEDAAELESQLVESVTAIGTVRRFGLEGYAALRTETRFVRLLRSVYRSGCNAILAGGSSEAVSRLGTVVLLWVGSGMVLEQAVTPGQLMSFYALAGYLSGPMVQLIGMNRTLQDALIAADRLFEILDLEVEPDGEGVELTEELLGDIRFERVGFRYGAREPVFDELSLVIPRGRLTAVVGESGSGKSTLLSLLQGLYPVDSGCIRIGAVNLRQVRPASLRRVVGVVPQEIHLFAGSVVENIAVGDPEPDMPRLLRVAAELGVTGFVEALPHGFQTLLGENGANLSGGQRQRLAIARALYRQPEILILDEATSHLDSESERYVHGCIERLRRQHRTVVLIAHRLSSVQGADRILVLQRGRLVEQGTHAELLARRGAYFRLWQSQHPQEGPPLDAGGEAEPAEWLRAI